MTVQTASAAAIIISAVSLLVIIAYIAASGRRKRGDILPEQIDRLERMSRGIEDLSAALLVPHLRGGLGETLLADLLKNWLPAGSYELQYRFRDGSRADAVIRLGRNIVAVDAKFPLESVRRSIEADPAAPVLTPDVRKAFIRHIETIAEKYIKPDQGTLQFALMYVPSEGVYYRTFVDSGSSLLAEAVERGVVPASPSTLFLYLQTVSYGLRGFAFSERQAELAALIRQLRTDFDAFSKHYALLGTHLKNLVRANDDAVTRLGRIDLALSRLDE